MKKTNLELLQYDEFWENNNKSSIRCIVKKFIQEHKDLEICYSHYVKECEKLRDILEETRGIRED